MALWVSIMALFMKTTRNYKPYQIVRIEWLNAVSKFNGSRKHTIKLGIFSTVLMLIIHSLPCASEILLVWQKTSHPR